MLDFYFTKDGYVTMQATGNNRSVELANQLSTLIKGASYEFPEESKIYTLIPRI